MDFIARYSYMIGFLFSIPGEIEAGSKEKSEDNRNEQKYFGFSHHFLRLERKGSDRNKPHIHSVIVRQDVHLSFEEEIVAQADYASDCDINQAFGI